MKKNDLREKIHLTSVDELFGLENSESSIEIAIDRIRSFKDHPFKVLDDDKMADLVESIKASEASVSKYLSELEEANLLERVQSAPGRLCKLYLKKLSYVCEV